MKIVYAKLLSSIGICLLAGGAGSIFTASNIPTWYSTLEKPSFNPPNYVFAPVWTILYILMGISFYLIWQTKGKRIVKDAGIILFILQLVLNVLWSIVFFGFHSPLGGMIVIALLWFLILLTILEFFKIKRVAAYLLIPYIIWVSFASFLNFSIYLLNG